MENARHLNPPPTQTLLVKTLFDKDRADLCSAAAALKQFVKHAKSLRQHFNVEEATLDSLLYRTNNRFRNDKGFKNAKMVLKVLRRLLEMDLGGVVDRLEASFPLTVDLAGAREKCYLPTRQMTEFVMVRLHGCFLLTEKLVVSCRLAGDLARKRLKLGHFWSTALNNLAIFGRIWSLCKTQLSLAHSLYAKLLPITLILPATEVPFLLDYQFPPSLLETLTEQGLRKEVEGIKLGDALLAVKKEKKVDDVVKMDEGVVIQREETCSLPRTTSKTLRAKKSTSALKSPAVPVKTREVLRDVELPCKPKLWRKICAAVDGLQSSQDLENFLQTESRTRKCDRKSAVTRTLDQGQFKELRSRVLARVSATKKAKALRKLKETIKVMILYPQNQGHAPDNWQQVQCLLNKQQ